LTPSTRFELGAPGERPAVGTEAIEALMREFLAQWNEYRVEAHAFDDFDDAVLVTERQHGLGRGSGVETEQTFYCVWRFRDGSVIGVRWDTSRKDALQAAGLSE
jgi:ketosteroid isomerase-like protein